MTRLNENEAPPGYIAVEDPGRYHGTSCGKCSMYVNGFCTVKSPHSCCCLDRVDGCDVIFAKINK